MLKSAASSGRRWSCYPRAAAGSTDAAAAPVDLSSSTSIAHLASSRIYYWSVSSTSMSCCQQLCWRKSAEQTHLGCFAGSRTSVATQQRSWGLSWSVWATTKQACCIINQSNKLAAAGRRYLDSAGPILQRKIMKRWRRRRRRRSKPFWWSLAEVLLLPQQPLLSSGVITKSCRSHTLNVQRLQKNLISRADCSSS